MLVYVIMAIIAYAIGSISFSVIISRKMAGFDVREKGSGNAGSTNMLRSVGKKAALLTLVCDILKGVVSVLLALIIGKINSNVDGAILVEIAAFFVVLGHTFPIFFEFRGGKGVATSLGVLLLINWKIGLICLVFALILMALTRMVSLGSISAAILFPVLCIFITDCYLVPQNHLSYIIFAIIMAVFIAYNHRSNIKRLLNGTENKISFKKTEN
ncbi:MAG: glycerol-3-phosphate 1-O-acyltransferase PlsY [Clostridia bacterium]|nr:glycerol-3-phosphate 1-O-acyltransferase PlsY [Clostridia bacterium]